MGATTSRGAFVPGQRILCVVLLFLAMLSPAAVVAAYAQDATPQQEGAPAEDDSRAARTLKFLLGGATGLGVHESGHLAFDGLFGVRPRLKKVDFGGIPFFAITHDPGLPDRKEFTISSAGFWTQHLSSEIVLTRHPRLADERAPMLKGWLAFNVLASVAYGAAAMAHAGPSERDTRAMGASLHMNEAWIGALVLIPAGLDAWRYFHPDARWAAWLSRGVKVGSVLLVVK